jgi:hypothetical protein
MGDLVGAAEKAGVAAAEEASAQALSAAAELAEDAAAADALAPAAAEVAAAAAAEPAPVSLREAATRAVGRLCYMPWALWGSLRPSTRLGPSAVREALRHPSAADALLGPDRSRAARHGVQARLSRFSAVLRFRHLMNVTLMPPSGSAGPRRVARARLLSQSALGAMLWTVVTGGRAGTCFTSAAFRLAALRAVGLQDGFPDEGACHHSACENNRTRLSPLHRRLCAHFKVSRHNAIVRMLLQILREAGISLVRRENSTPFDDRVRANGQIRAVGRGDLVVHYCLPPLMGDAELEQRFLIVDVCVGDPAATQSCDASWHSPCVAAAGMEAQKHIRYMTPGTPRSHTEARRAIVEALPPSAAPLPPAGPAAAAAAEFLARRVPTADAVWAPADCEYAHASYVLLPFAMETHGRMGPTASRLLRALAVHASGGPGEGGNAAERGRLLHRWRLLLSCALTRAVSVQALSHPGPLRTASPVAPSARRGASPAPSASALASVPLPGCAPALPGSTVAAPLAAASLGGFTEGLHTAAA